MVASNLKDTRAAARDAVDRAMARLESKATAAMVFFGSTHDPETVATTVGEALGDVPWIGAMTDGEIADGLVVDSVAVVLIASDRVRVTTHVIERLSEDSEAAGAGIAQALRREEARALVLLPDGLTGNGSAIIRGAQRVLGRSFVIGGGTAGDGGKFERTHQLANGRSYTDALVGMMFHGGPSLEVGFGVMSGWKALGVAKEVTDAEGNLVREIEGRSALSVYETFLGDRASQLPAIGVEYPFALVDESGKVGEAGMSGEEYILLRAPMSVDHATGTVSFAAEIPKGAKIKMTRGRSDAIIDGARVAAERTQNRLTGRPDLVLFFSCMARRVVLGRRTVREVDAAREVFGTDVPMGGFYTYGEIANCGTESPMCRFHNETATFLAFREV